MSADCYLGLENCSDRVFQQYPPIAAIHGRNQTRPAISQSGSKVSNLIGAVPHQNFPGDHSQKLRQHHTRVSVPCPGAKENPGQGGDAGTQSGRPPTEGACRPPSYPKQQCCSRLSGHVRRVFLTQPELLSPSIARRWIIRRRSWIDGRRLQVVQLLLVQLPGDVTA
jgi:hypothetical protein